MLDGIVGVIDGLSAKLDDAAAMLELAVEDDDESLLSDVQAELDDALNSVEELEFRRMFSGEMDANNCYLDIQSGSGGTEAQDWAQMLLRMYLRWCESHGFKAEVLEVSEGAWQASNQQPLWLKVIMLLAGFVLRLVCIAWCVSRLLTVIMVAIPRLQRCLSRLRLMIILTLTSTLPICVLILIVQAGQAVSMSIRPIRQYALPINQQVWLLLVKMNALNMPTKILP